VLAVRLARVNVPDHHSLAVADEGVLQHEGKLAGAEGSVVFALIQRPDALLQRQQGLVDLCSVYPVSYYQQPVRVPGLLVGLGNIRAPLVACQVDEAHFPVDIVPLPKGDLQDRVRPRRFSVRGVLAGHPHGTAEVYGLH